MVAGFSLAAVAAALLPLGADAAQLQYDAEFGDLNDLKPREVTVTVTVCPEAASTFPVYTTAALPPSETAPVTTPTSYTTSVVPPGSDTGGSEGPTSASVFSIPPIVPLPTTPITYGTTEPANPPISTSVDTAITGTETTSDAATTHPSSEVTTHSVLETTGTGGPSSALPSSGGSDVAPVNYGLMILVAMAALA